MSRKSVSPFPFVRHLDRLQFSVWNGEDVYKGVCSQLESLFSYLDTKRQRSRIVRRFRGGVSAIRLIYYGDRSRWFSISVSDPSKDIQTALLKVFQDLGCSVSLTQAEFALDFRPTRFVSLDDLFSTLSSSAVLRHSRGESYRCIGEADPTHYQGHRGNVRKGSKGLRVYKKNRRLVRVELQCNRRFLKKARIGVNSLPIQTDAVDVLDYVDFRKQLDLRGFIHLVEGTCYRKWKRGSAAFDEMVGKASGEAPAAEQLIAFKKLRRGFSFTSQAGEFFPVDGELTSMVKDVTKRKETRRK